MKSSQIIFFLKNFDWLTFMPAIILTLFGLASLYAGNLNAAAPDLTLFYKQLAVCLVGLVLVFLIAACDFRIFRNYGLPLYLVSVILMIAVLIFGTSIRGTRGWFYIFGFVFQPVELMKIALIVILALVYNRRKGREKSSGTIAWVVGATLLPTILAALQPDMGSAFVLLGIGVLFFFLFSMERRHAMIIIFALVILCLLLWNFILVDYQKNRMLTFIDPDRDPQGRGYNVRQSVIAIGSGQIFGRGLGLGSQSQLKFLPETSTDFIFAAIAEALGFFGAGVIIVLFGFLLLRLGLVMEKSRSSFGASLVFGFGSIIFIHASVNIGMNIGLMPVTGISLPFVSYGGSFLAICLIGMGIVQSVSFRSRAV